MRNNKSRLVISHHLIYVLDILDVYLYMSSPCPQISQLQATIASASLFPPQFLLPHSAAAAVDGSSSHASGYASCSSHGGATSVNQGSPVASRGTTRPPSNVASARSSPPPSLQQQQQQQQQYPQQQQLLQPTQPQLLAANNLFTPVMLSMSKASSRRVSSSSSSRVCVCCRCLV